MTNSAVLLAGLIVTTTACYGGKRATVDVNEAWRGRTQGELVRHWGKPGTVRPMRDGSHLVWTRTGRRITLPYATGRVDVGPGRIDIAGEFSPGSIRTTTHELIAAVDARGIVGDIRGRSLRKGPPSGLNMRWGFLLGGHVGMGRLDDTKSALPSGGLYIGGMLSRTVGLVGTYSMAAGKDDAGSAMAFGWGLGVQVWTSARTWLRAGPAMVLAFNPGFEDAGLEPGIAVGGSYAIVRSRSFVLDLRVDLVGGTETSFGTLGLGVNIN